MRGLVKMRDAIEAVRHAFIAVSAGHIEQPTRLVVDGGRALAMLACDREAGGTVLKGITIHSENPSAGRPAVQAAVLWFSGATGTPEALIDGTTLTAMRTGAASGVATDLLAAPRAGVLAVIGSGGQAPDQIRAVCAVRPIREVRIVSRTPANARRVAKAMSRELDPVRVVPFDKISKAIHDADVICTATDSREPLFDLSDLQDRVHVNAIGAFTEDMCELPAALLEDASVIAIDQIDATMAEAGDLLRALRSGHIAQSKLAEIGVLLTRPQVSVGRTVFKSVGIAAQDWALAKLVVEKASSSAGGLQSWPGEWPEGGGDRAR